MNARQWKSGDVALLSMARGNAVGIWTGEFWAWSDGAGPYEGVSHAHDSVPVRPLVVIDPEEIVHPETLIEFLRERGWKTIANAIDAALTPPRPEEPTGLGAVVEGEDGKLWVRTRNGDDHLPAWDEVTTGTVGLNVDYVDTLAVRVLNHGWTNGASA